MSTITLSPPPPFRFLPLLFFYHRSAMCFSIIRFETAHVPYLDYTRAYTFAARVGSAFSHILSAFSLSECVCVCFYTV